MVFFGGGVHNVRLGGVPRWPMRILFAVLLFVSFAGSRACFAKEVVFAVGEWPPYLMQQEQGRGLAVELVNAAFKGTDITPKLTFSPWKRALERLKKGDVVGSFPWVMHPSRTPYAYGSDAFLPLEEVLVYQKRRFPEGVTVSSFADMKAYRFIGIIGYLHNELFTEHGMRAHSVPDNVSGLRMLREGRGDFLLENELVVRHILRKYFPEQAYLFGFAPNPHLQGHMDVLFSKAHPDAEEVMTKFNKGLHRIRQNGEYDRLVEKYLNGG